MFLALPTDMGLLLKLLEQVDELDGTLARMVEIVDSAVEGEELQQQLVPHCKGEPSGNINFAFREGGIASDEVRQSFRALQQTLSTQLVPLRYLTREEVVRLLREFAQIEEATRVQW